METNIQNTEIEQMRKQMNLLQHKLAHQEIVSDKLIKNSMKNKMQWIKTYIIVEMVVMLPLSMVCFVFAKFWCEPYFHISWFFLAFLLLGLVADILLDYRINVSSIKDSDFNHDSLNATAVKLAKMKSLRLKQLKWGFVFLAVALGWLFIEAWLTVSPSSYAKGLLTAFTIGGAVGLVIGAYAGIYVLRKMQHTNDELIDQIHEVTNEQDDIRASDNNF
ncbi:MAG: hypothetical protein ACOYJF_08285 [Prevotella sp.]|jgi:hypothetical protein